MKIGYYPRYDRLGASSRHRFFNYVERWLHDESAGLENVIYPGLSDKYLQKLYRAGKVGKIDLFIEMAKLFRRACFTACDAMVIEYELMPDLPYTWERKLIGDRPYILNYDDNVWVKYNHKPLLKNKFDALCRSAAGVIVANKFLQEKISQLNPNVCMIPTAVDLAAYKRNNLPKFEDFTLVWIGTPVTYKYLEQHLGILQTVSRQLDCTLLIVADKRLEKQRPLSGVKARYVDWSPDSEAEYLLKSHVGIMPLTDDEFSRGKSAFKLLQYQAAGLPLIASPVGENNQVVTEGVNGFLAQSGEEWLQAVKSLRSDSALYCRLAAGAQLKAQEYSLEKYLPVFQNFILDSFRKN